MKLPSSLANGKPKHSMLRLAFAGLWPDVSAYVFCGFSAR